MGSCELGRIIPRRLDDYAFPVLITPLHALGCSHNNQSPVECHLRMKKNGQSSSQFRCLTLNDGSVESEGNTQRPSTFREFKPAVLPPPLTLVRSKAYS